MAGTAMDEIDGVIRELESVREQLRSEGERVNREIANYADLTRAAISAVRDISANIRIENSRTTD
jgi:vacuolar-type H+-ATPase subunit I/STV1